MLQAYWNLNGHIFDKSIKTDQLFISNSAKELMSRLDYMKQHRGIMLIHGQPGTGKTTMLRAFANNLSEASFKTFYVPLATVSVLDFYRQLNYHLSGEQCHSKARLFSSIQKNIIELTGAQKRIPVIIFDEAHLMKNDNFAELQMLFNFNMDSVDPALLIMAGHSYLLDRLMRPMLASFYQRILLKHQLLPLDKQQTRDYIEHHLTLKGCHEFPFTDSAIDAIFKNSNGVPRIIASLCLLTMTLGMNLKLRQLTEEHVFQAAREL